MRVELYGCPWNGKIHLTKKLNHRRRKNIGLCLNRKENKLLVAGFIFWTDILLIISLLQF